MCWLVLKLVVAVLGLARLTGVLVAPTSVQGLSGLTQYGIMGLCWFVCLAVVSTGAFMDG
jgi:hypothetical protein